MMKVLIFVFSFLLFSALNATSHADPMPMTDLNQPFVGVMFIPVDSGGLMIIDTLPGAPAETGKLQKKDIVLKVNTLKVNDIDTYSAILSKLPMGTPVDFEIKRANKIMHASILPVALTPEFQKQRDDHFAYFNPSTATLSNYPFSLLPPRIEEFDAAIPYWKTMFNRKKRENEINVYWLERLSDLKKSVDDCQRLNDKSLLEQCYQQIRIIEAKKTQAIVDSGNIQIQAGYQQQRRIDNATQQLQHSLDALAPRTPVHTNCSQIGTFTDCTSY